MPLVVRILDTPAGRCLPLDEGTTIIGRAPDCAIRLDGADVSRHHVSLRVTDGRVWARDLGSRNATFLDDKLLEQETEWHPGERLFVADVLLELTDTLTESRGRGPVTRRPDTMPEVPLSELSCGTPRCRPEMTWAACTMPWRRPENCWPGRANWER